MIDLKFKRLHENAIIPQYATDGSLGLDLTAVSKKGYNSYENLSKM